MKNKLYSLCFILLALLLLFLPFSFALIGQVKSIIVAIIALFSDSYLLLKIKKINIKE